MPNQLEQARSALIRSLALCESGCTEAAVLHAFCAIGFMACGLGDGARQRVATWLAQELTQCR